MHHQISWFLGAALAGVVAVWSPALAGDGLGPHLHGSRGRASEHECVCPAAEASNGWCDACAVGYVASLRIPSASLFELLDPHGHEVDLSASSCPACPLAMESDGFCEAHGIGYVEGRGYVNRLTYLLAKGEPVLETEDYLRLRRALGYLDTCESCALASFANSRCPKCGVRFRDGLPLPIPPEEVSP